MSEKRRYENIVEPLDGQTEDICADVASMLRTLESFLADLDERDLAALRLLEKKRQATLEMLTKLQAARHELETPPSA